jgi:hypothetical protein
LIVDDGIVIHSISCSFLPKNGVLEGIFDEGLWKSGTICHSVLLKKRPKWAVFHRKRHSKIKNGGSKIEKQARRAKIVEKRCFLWKTVFAENRFL